MNAPTLRHPPGGNLFLGLWPDPTARTRIHALGSRYVRCGRHVHEADLHLTLLFIGHADTAMHDCLMCAAGDLARTCTRFTVMLDCIGHWRQSRIAWLAPTNPPGSLYELVFALRDAATRCGLNPERRPYSPHVTLCRRATPVKQDLVEPIALRVESFVLAVSHPGAEPRYEQLAGFTLAGAQHACIPPPGR